MAQINDDQIEQRAQTNGPRVTADDITNLIVMEYYWQVPNTTVTVCCLVLKNGFCVVGSGACISPENFDAALGKDIAYTDARNKIWELEGYLRKQRLAEAEGIAPYRVDHKDQHL
jgi:Phage protein (N4 Gp49/phage Sf6 gene 66) family